MMCYWGYTSPSHPLDLRKFVGQAQEEIQRITKKGVKSLGPLVTVGVALVICHGNLRKTGGLLKSWNTNSTTLVVDRWILGILEDFGASKWTFWWFPRYRTMHHTFWSNFAARRKMWEIFGVDQSLETGLSKNHSKNMRIEWTNMKIENLVNPSWIWMNLAKYWLITD